MSDVAKGKEAGLAALEAVLFVIGEAISLTKLAGILDTDKEETETLVRELGESLESDPKRGLRIIRDGEDIQFATKPHLKSAAGKAVKEEFGGNLTPAALETLSITAYGGPLSRAEIDYLRGVNSAFTLRNLLVRGLVLRDYGGKNSGAYLYKTTPVFLRHLGLKTIQDMPGYEEERSLIRNFISKKDNVLQLPA